MVQGVGFRYSARNVAKSFGIRGFARNHSDGSVYIEAEGTEKDMNQFIAWCNQGPPHAIVSRLEVSDGKIKNFGTFEIII